MSSRISHKKNDHVFNEIVYILEDLNKFWIWNSLVNKYYSDFPYVRQFRSIQLAQCWEGALYLGKFQEPQDIEGALSFKPSSNNLIAILGRYNEGLGGSVTLRQTVTDKIWKDTGCLFRHGTITSMMTYNNHTILGICSYRREALCKTLVARLSLREAAQRSRRPIFFTSPSIRSVLSSWGSIGDTVPVARSPGKPWKDLLGCGSNCNGRTIEIWCPLTFYHMKIQFMPRWVAFFAFYSNFVWNPFPKKFFKPLCRHLHTHPPFDVAPWWETWNTRQQNIQTNVSISQSIFVCCLEAWKHFDFKKTDFGLVQIGL